MTMHDYFARKNYGKSRMLDSLCRKHGEVLQIGNRIYVGYHRRLLNEAEGAEGGRRTSGGHLSSDPADSVPEANREISGEPSAIC